MVTTVSEFLGEDGVAELFGGQDEATGQAVETPASESPKVPTEAPTEETTAIVATTPAPAAPATIEDDRYFEQLDLLAKMADCERRRVEIAGELAEAKETVKDLNAQLKSCMIDMQEIASDIRDLMSNTYIPERKAFADQPAAKIESKETEVETPGQVEDWGDGRWREGKTAEVMDGVKGLGKKKLEALTDLAPTIGELEDLRGTSYGVFKNVLPQGFGDKVASEIEDRLIAYIAAHSTPPASEQVKLNVIAADDDQAESQSDVVTLEEVQGFIEQYRNDAEIEKWDERDCDFENEEISGQQSPAAIEGFDHFCEGASIEDYPQDMTAGELADWAYGYVCAEVMERIHQKEELQVLKQSETGQAVTDPVDEFADL